MTEAWQWLQVVNVFNKAIDYELGLRGVDPESPELKHSLSADSGAATGAIRKSLNLDELWVGRSGQCFVISGRWSLARVSSLS